MQLTLALLGPSPPARQSPRQELDAETRAEASTFWHASSRKPARQPRTRRRLMNDITKIGASHLGRAAYIISDIHAFAGRAQHRNQHNANTPWPPGRRHLAGRRAGHRCRRRPRAFRFRHRRAQWLRPAHRRSRPRRCRDRARPRISRLARNNADWYRLLDLCGLTDTLIGDADGIYHPADVQRSIAARSQGHHERG